MSDTVCKHCGYKLHLNEGEYPGRGRWLDKADWSVCDWTYRNHEPIDGSSND